MTSHFDHMTQGWAMFSRGNDLDGSDKMFLLLKLHGIVPKEFLTYGDNKTFLDSQLVNTNETLAFHRGSLIGNIDAVRTYIDAVRTYLSMKEPLRETHTG